MITGPDSRDTSVERLTPVVRRLLLWRHGETYYNAASRMQGQLDTDLSERGSAKRWPPRPRSLSATRWQSGRPIFGAPRRPPISSDSARD